MAEHNSYSPARTALTLISPPFLASGPFLEALEPAEWRGQRMDKKDGGVHGVFLPHYRLQAGASVCGRCPCSYPGMTSESSGGARVPGGRVSTVIGKVLCRVEARPVGPQPWPTTPAGHVISWTPVSHPGKDPSTSPVHLPGVSKKSSVAITNLALCLRWTLSPFGYPASRHTFYLGESLLWENLGGRQKIYLLPSEAREASCFLSWNPLSPTSPSSCPLTHTHTHTHTILTHPSLGPWRPLPGPANVKAVVHRWRSSRDESLGQRRLRGAEEPHPQGVGARVVESPVSRGPVSLSLWGELAGAGGCWVSTDFTHVLWGSH